MAGKVQRGGALDEFLSREGRTPINAPDQEPRRYLYNQDRIIRLEELLKHFSRDPETGEIIIHIENLRGYDPTTNTDGASIAELEEITSGEETDLHKHPAGGLVGSLYTLWIPFGTEPINGESFTPS